MRFDEIKALIPAPPCTEIDWSGWERTELRRYIERMRATPQSALWHGEGDVWTHTKMVCGELVSDSAYGGLAASEREAVFLAALLHDVGKVSCTAVSGDEVTSAGHAIAGSKLARAFLWTEWELCGTAEARALRETVCTLIRYHSTPPHLGIDGEAERKLIEIASFASPVPYFSLELLSILVRADIKGRIARDLRQSLETVDMAFLLAAELGITRGSYPFPDPVTKHAYLSGRAVARDYPLYDDTWREVILLSGLPGTGKDTWIRKNCPALPVISLDDIRLELKISPTDKEKQGVVISCARERARELLRKKEPFVWNATNITAQIRLKQLDLFRKYHAYTRVVFLETSLSKELERNAARTTAVPEGVIYDLLSKTELPAPSEAHSVEWVIT